MAQDAITITGIEQYQEALRRMQTDNPATKKELQAKFMSYKFRQVIPTLIERFVIIILAYCVERRAYFFR